MTHFRRCLERAAAAVLIVAWAAPAAAQDCAQLRSQLDKAGTATFAALNRLERGGCLGGDADRDPAAVRAQEVVRKTAKVEGKRRAAVKDVVLSADERRSFTLAMLRIADEYLGTLAAGGEEAEAIKTLRGTLQQAMRDRSAGVEDTPQQSIGYWTWDGLQNQPNQRPLGGTEIDIHAMLARGSRATVEGLMRAAHIATRAFSADQAQAIREAAAQAAVRDARWRSYFADTRSQYPWEMLVNSWIYDSSVRSEAGISGPPRWQLIALHPDVGLQYVKSAAAGDRFKPALVLEVIGYNGWSWGSGNKAQNGWGGSIVRTYADTASVPSGAWGLAIHRNSKYTLTINRLDGKTGFLFSIDLLGSATKASEEWSERLRFGR